ncbi:MAG: CinA family protein [Acidobacteriaceae bacterium]|nr:CinA family protein [Acidobacteriaceae bacterium]MBV8523251.1 CinA family protein [Acetobacteraceae bacterium]
MIIPLPLLAFAQEVLAGCRSHLVKLATAESCTGGLVAATLTAIAGSSEVVDRGFVTYSNAAKVEMLGIPPDLIDAHGAVSEAVARAMARSALARSRSDLAIAITGIAGPSGGTPEKPVGLVWFGLASRAGLVKADKVIFPGDRQAVRIATVRRSFELIQDALELN